MGQELLSIKQQAKQELIRENVWIDPNLNRVKVKLPFLCDPNDKVIDNIKIAEKRLNNIVKK